MSFLALLSAEARDELRAFVAAEVAAALAARDRQPQKRWLTAAETGDYLGTSARAIYRRIERGRIAEGAVRRSGRTLLVDRLALDRTLETS